MIRVTSLLLALLSIPLVFASNLTAQSRQEVEKKVHAVERQIHKLHEQAEAWEEKGWEGKAEKLRKQASNMERELHAWIKKLEQRETENSRKVLAGLLAGARSLRHLGREDQAEELERIAKDLARDIEREQAERKKREEIDQHLGFLRIAVLALVEADKRESAERVEHFMHSVELTLEGREDKEALRIRKRSPKPKVILEDLEIAVRFLRKEGQKKKAEAVLKVLHKIETREKAHRRKDNDDDDDADDDGDQDDENEERIEELEKKIRKIERYLGELSRALKEIKQRD